MILINIGYTGSGKTSRIYALRLLSSGKSFGIESIDVGFVPISGRPRVKLSRFLNGEFLRALRGLKKSDPKEFNVIKTNPSHVYSSFSRGRYEDYLVEIEHKGKKIFYLDSVGASRECVMRYLVSLITLTKDESVIEGFSKLLAKISKKVSPGREKKAREKSYKELSKAVPKDKRDEVRSFLELTVEGIDKASREELFEGFSSVIPYTSERFDALMDVMTRIVPHVLKTLRSLRKRMKEARIGVFIPSTQSMSVLSIHPITNKYGASLLEKTLEKLGYKIRKLVYAISFASAIRYPEEFREEFFDRLEELKHGDVIEAPRPSKKPFEFLEEQYLVDMRPVYHGSPGMFVPHLIDGKIVHVNVQRLLEKIIE